MAGRIGLMLISGAQQNIAKALSLGICHARMGRRSAPSRGYLEINRRREKRQRRQALSPMKERHHSSPRYLASHESIGDENEM